MIKPIEGDVDEHEISAGVVIKWNKDKLKDKNHRVTIVLDKVTRTTQMSYTGAISDITVDVKPNAFNFLSDIDLRKIDLISFRFLNASIPQPSHYFWGRI